MDTINSGLLPCNPSLANEADPICTTCQFDKEHKRSYKRNIGKISDGHTAPGQGVSSDGMEAGCPGHVMTTHGLPSTKKFCFVSFWIDHNSHFHFSTHSLVHQLCQGGTKHSTWTAFGLQGSSTPYECCQFSTGCRRRTLPVTHIFRGSLCTLATI
jgi:hypothetical protein